MSAKHDDDGGYPRDYPKRRAIDVRPPDLPLQEAPWFYAPPLRDTGETARSFLNNGFSSRATFFPRPPVRTETRAEPEDPRSLSRDELVRRALRARR